MTTAEMLQLPRIPWRRIVAAGGDLARIEQEAAQAGDHELLRRLRRHLAR